MELTDGSGRNRQAIERGGEQQTLVLIVMDWVKRRAFGGGKNGIRCKFTSKQDDLDFADDIVLLSSTKQ